MPELSFGTNRPTLKLKKQPENHIKTYFIIKCKNLYGDFK